MLLEYIDKINNTIREFLSTRIHENPLIREMLEYNRKFMLSGGKRIRPLLMIMAYSLNNEIDDRIIKASISIEFLHNYFLVYDDIMDEAPLRRGITTVHMYFANKGKEMRIKNPELFGISMAILAGGLLKSYAVEALLDSGFPPEKIAKALEVLKSRQRRHLTGRLLILR